MEVAATPEVPSSKPENLRSPRRKPRLWLVFGLAVIVLGFVGLNVLRARHDRLVHPVSITFLGYTNTGPSGLNSRWAVFRITNRGRYRLLCDEQEVDIKVAEGWLREINSVE